MIERETYYLSAENLHSISHDVLGRVSRQITASGACNLDCWLAYDSKNLKDTRTLLRKYLRYLTDIRKGEDIAPSGSSALPRDDPEDVSTNVNRGAVVAQIHRYPRQTPHDENLVDLSLVGPGESTRRRKRPSAGLAIHVERKKKRTADGELKCATVREQGRPRNPSQNNTLILPLREGHADEVRPCTSTSNVIQEDAPKARQSFGNGIAGVLSGPLRASSSGKKSHVPLDGTGNPTLNVEVVPLDAEKSRNGPLSVKTDTTLGPRPSKASTKQNGRSKYTGPPALLTPAAQRPPETSNSHASSTTSLNQPESQPSSPLFVPILDTPDLPWDPVRSFQNKSTTGTPGRSDTAATSFTPLNARDISESPHFVGQSDSTQGRSPRSVKHGTGPTKEPQSGSNTPASTFQTEVLFDETDIMVMELRKRWRSERSSRNSQPPQTCSPSLSTPRTRTISRGQSRLQSTASSVSELEEIGHDEPEKSHMPLTARVKHCHTEPISREGIVRLRQHLEVVQVAQEGNMPRPYLSRKERAWLSASGHAGLWQMASSNLLEGQLLHADFSASEMDALLLTVRRVLRIPNEDEDTSDTEGANIGEDSVAALLHRYLLNSSEHQLSKIARRALANDRGMFLRSRFEDVLTFLRDTVQHKPPRSPSIIRVKRLTDGFGLSTRHPASAVRLMHQRESGLGAPTLSCTSPTALSNRMKTLLLDPLKPLRAWSPGSSDVITLAWNPDSDVFVAGCAATTDDDNMQYNRCNNLVMGDAVTNVIRELADHRLPRHRSSTGPNSTDAIMNTLDPWLYYTISSVSFSPSGQRFFSSSYDRTVKMWDVSRSSASRGTVLQTIQHDGLVDLLTTSIEQPLLLATGSEAVDDSIRLYRFDDTESSISAMHYFSSSRALKQPQKQLHPCCMQFGHHPAVQHLLLVGFSPNYDDDKTPSDGDLCMWNVETQQRIKVSPTAQNMFDCVWHPEGSGFATGCVADTRANKGTKSYVRLYDADNLAFRSVMDLECPALDINCVTWCKDDRYCTASCTDGNTYVWDLRMRNHVLHVLNHGEPIAQLPSRTDPFWKPREQADTGVRFCDWGPDLGAERLYTASSDGVLKMWNIKLAAENVLVKDVAAVGSGIMSAAFSPDRTKVVLGDAAGGIHMLGLDHGGQDEDEESEPSQFRYEKAKENDEEIDQMTVGTLEARRMVDAGEIEIDRSHGPGQAVRGPQYRGPWARDRAVVEEMDVDDDDDHEDEDDDDDDDEDDVEVDDFELRAKAARRYGSGIGMSFADPRVDSTRGQRPTTESLRRGRGCGSRKPSHAGRSFAASSEDVVGAARRALSSADQAEEYGFDRGIFQ
ncbi:MAG: hypothetical protein M1817_004501 [Caeruleum heppii]|nr:MAG: hypothetical protein M1817_004501 [Caeruleum heppii]